jgi:hypothetical protein
MAGNDATILESEALIQAGTAVANYADMLTDWPISPVLMILSFPLLCGALMVYVHGIVEFAPRTIRAHRVSYRAIQTRIADWLLILRLVLARN